MCKFCENDYLTEICCEKLIFGILGNANLTLDINNEYLYANLIGNGYSQVNVELKMEINFCPMCGRKLESEE